MKRNQTLSVVAAKDGRVVKLSDAESAAGTDPGDVYGDVFTKPASAAFASHSPKPRSRDAEAGLERGRLDAAGGTGGAKRSRRSRHGRAPSAASR